LLISIFILPITDVFDAIVPRSAKHERSPDYILAGILANGLRLGTDAMGSISDLNPHSLLSVEKGCIRMETLTAALNVIYEHTFELPIFKDWNIDGVGHGSLDGMKISLQFAHNKAQPSPKYFKMGSGVSSYSLILNHFALAGKLIGANEYEGHFAFELSQFQYAQPNLLQRISTDKHGVNSINFLLFHLVDKLFAPRIPQPHHEALWGFSDHKQTAEVFQPSKYFDEALWCDEWDNVQHVVASILTGDVNASIIVNKLASSRYNSKTKLAFMQFNNILKTNFILRYVHDLRFRHAIERALNRGEAFNRLYRAIALLNKGQLRGHSEIEMMIWDACTRLLTSIIQYYNALILNHFYEKATNAQSREFLLRASPTAWGHINLLGHYQFRGNEMLGMSRWLRTLRLEDCISVD
jgi:TnpA family transposase